MPALTLKGIPDDVMERLRELADSERRSLNQQAILLLERALAEHPASFETAYRRFREQRGPSPVEAGDMEGLRSSDAGRSVNL
jgi:predicted transcriptional regulator